MTRQLLYEAARVYRVKPVRRRPRAFSGSGFTLVDSPYGRRPYLVIVRRTTGVVRK